MTVFISPLGDDMGRVASTSNDSPIHSGSALSAVSWGAIIAGAAAAASMSLILLILGVGLGLSSVSPWVRDGITAKTFGVSTIVWLTVTQLVSAAVGGYLAGRLRTKWTEVHSDEVYFRDTAHGFLAWAVASLVSAALLTSVIGSIVGGGIQAVSSVASGVASAASPALSTMAASTRADRSSENGPMAYTIDSLFRRPPTGSSSAETTTGSTAGTPGASPSRDASTANLRPSKEELSEVSRIFTNIKSTEPLPAEDVKYVGQLVAQPTGLNQQAAEKRVTDLYTKAQTTFRDAETAARETADKARKASAYGALWLFVSLLIGAFVASLSATYGGRLRDV